MAQSDSEQLYYSEFRDTFDHFDTYHSGLLGKLELRGALMSIGEDRTDKQMDALIKELDKDGDNKISMLLLICYLR